MPADSRQPCFSQKRNPTVSSGTLLNFPPSRGKLQGRMAGIISRISRWSGCRSLRVRVIVLIFLPLFLVLAGVTASVLLHLEREAQGRMREEVELIARALQSPLAYSLERGREGTIREALRAAFRIERVYGAYVYDDAGRIVATAGEVDLDRELKSSIARVVESGERSGEHSRVAGRAVYSYFVPLRKTDGEIAGLLQVTRREEDFQAYMRGLHLAAASYLLLGTLLLTSVVFIGYHAAMGRAFNRLREDMAVVERGNIAHRAAEDGPDEIAQSGVALNAMLDSFEVALREIERRKVLELSLEQRLQRSEKLAILGKVAAGMAHELGAPLTVIDASAQRALRRRDNPSSLHEIRAQVSRMEQLVRQLLEFGRPAGSNQKRIQADRLADMAVRAASHTHPGCSSLIEIQGPRPGPVLRVSPFRVELALSNLIRNALQIISAREGRVEIRWFEEEDKVAFEINDNGPGIPPELQNRIFDPFFTTKEERHGCGLGLAIVQQVADEHGGSVRVASSRWGGARFCLSFPRWSEAA